jgi:hypothetical protein
MAAQVAGASEFVPGQLVLHLLKLQDVFCRQVRMGTQAGWMSFAARCLAPSFSMTLALPMDAGEQRIFSTLLSMSSSVRNSGLTEVVCVRLL